MVTKTVFAKQIGAVRAAANTDLRIEIDFAESAVLALAAHFDFRL